MLKKPSILLIIVFFSLFIQSSLGNSSSFTLPDPPTTPNVMNLKKVGQAILKFKLMFMSWDVYEMAYFQSQDKSARMLQIKFLRDIEKKHLKKGWEKGLEGFSKLGPEYSKGISWFKKTTPKGVKGDIFSILVEGEEVSFFLNQDKLGQRRGPELSEMALASWLGKNPVDKELKRKLLSLPKRKKSYYRPSVRSKD